MQMFAPAGMRLVTPTAEIKAEGRSSCDPKKKEQSRFGLPKKSGATSKKERQQYEKVRTSGLAQRCWKSSMATMN
jgi:hypothetical protein